MRTTQMPDSFDSSHPARHAYISQMEGLELRLIEMGSRAEQMVVQAAESLTTLNTEKARDVLSADDAIDRLDLEIEAECLEILALQNPMAGDLRTIGTLMKIIADLERIGDLAVDLARITLKVDKEMGSPSVVDIVPMANEARMMLRNALQSFASRDMKMVEQVCLDDEKVDAQYRETRDDIFKRLHDPDGDVVSLGWHLLAIHHIERIADHSVNIAERVGFMISGQVVKAWKFCRPDDLDSTP